MCLNFSSVISLISRGGARGNPPPSFLTANILTHPIIVEADSHNRIKSHSKLSQQIVHNGMRQHTIYTTLSLTSTDHSGDFIDHVPLLETQGDVHIRGPGEARQGASRALQGKLSCTNPPSKVTPVTLPLYLSALPHFSSIGFL